MEFKVLQAFEQLPDNTFCHSGYKVESSHFLTLMKHRQKRLYNWQYICKSMDLVNIMCVIRNVIYMFQANYAIRHFAKCSDILVIHDMTN